MGLCSWICCYCIIGKFNSIAIRKKITSSLSASHRVNLSRTFTTKYPPPTPVSYTHLYPSGQEVGADKVRRTVMGAFLVVAADITVLLAFVRLVSLLIHHAAAVRTEQYAREQTHFIIAVWAFALFAKLLHPFPCLGVYDRLVVVLEYRLLFLRVDVYKRQASISPAS